ncbi:MAG: ATP-binding protein, partial [Acidimicrobiia bacterium]
LHVAADVVDQFEKGVWLADLASLTDPSLVPAAVASALRLPEEKERDSTSTLIDHIADASALIVIDNCEHLVHACADLAAALLRACPALTIIATSREPLGVDGETAWRVPSLSLPDESHSPSFEDLFKFEAVKLFIDRAIKSRPNFRVTDENAPAVTQVCHRLDGIPLAIELAAARVRVLSPEEIADGLANRFHLLTGGARTAMPRQRTLQASVEWSYNLLSEQEQLLLNSLSVFAGGFTLDAAEAAGSSEQVPAGQVLDLLSQLIDKSLVLVEDTHSPASRYRMLETIRQYATDRLLESSRVEEVRGRHMNYFLALAESLTYETGNPVIMKGVPELVREVDNMRAAARWALSHEDPSLKLRMAAITVFVLIYREHQREARALIDEALASSEAAAPMARGRGLIAKAYSSMWMGAASAVRSIAEEALKLANETGDTATAADARMMVAQHSYELGDEARLRSITDEMRATSEPGSAAQATPMLFLGGLLLTQGAFAESDALFAEAEQLLRASAELLELANLLMHIPYSRLYLGEFDRAASAAAEANQIIQ